LLTGKYLTFPRAPGSLREEGWEEKKQRRIMVSVRSFIQRHPQITAWIALAIGMVIILIWSARDVGFTGGQWAALIVTTILLAGACVWIIGWGEDEDEEAELARPTGETAEAAESGEAETRKGEQQRGRSGPAGV
jgi:hypothetical protein